MKINKKITTALLVLAGVAFIGTSAPAQVASPGDLVLAFRLTNSGGTGTDLEFDLGAITSFTSAGFNQGLLMNVNADLITTYGANWNTNANLVWSVVGTNTVGSSSKKQIYISNPTNAAVSPISSVGTPYANISYIYQGTGTALTLGTQVSETTSTSYYQTLTNASGANGPVPYSNDYGFAPYATEQSVSASGSSLDVYHYNGTQTSPNTPAGVVDAGTFSLSSSGAFSVTTPVAVPEPASYVLCGIAGVLFVIMRRRSRIQV